MCAFSPACFASLFFLWIGFSFTLLGLAGRLAAKGLGRAAHLPHRQKTHPTKKNTNKKKKVESRETKTKLMREKNIAVITNIYKALFNYEKTL